MKILFLCVLTFLGLGMWTPSICVGAFAVENRVAILVNGQPITLQELRQRLQLAALSGGFAPNAENLKLLQPNIVHAMINELLQLQVAKKFKLTLTEEQLQEGIHDLERMNGMKRGQIRGFLSKHNIPLETLAQQVRANLLWIDYIRALYQGSVRIPEEKVNQTLRCYQANQRQPKHHLGEIVLYVDNPKTEKRVQEKAIKLAQLLQQGASFPGLAYRFSESPSAKQGGDMGWVLVKDLDPVLHNAVQKTQVGQFSGPWRTSSGFVLLAVIQKRSGEETKQQGDISKAQVEQMLRSERLELLSRAELEKLRKQAVVESRNLPF